MTSEQKINNNEEIHRFNFHRDTWISQNNRQGKSEKSSRGKKNKSCSSNLIYSKSQYSEEAKKHFKVHTFIKNMYFKYLKMYYRHKDNMYIVK